MTRELGARLADGLHPGSVVALQGELGTGKTCMIQGICAALGVREYVTSPTFILINEYHGYLSGQPIEVYHFDLYRLRWSAELEELGADEYFYGQGICLVEWPERAGDFLPPHRVDVTLEHSGTSRRTITVRNRVP